MSNEEIMKRLCRIEVFLNDILNQKTCDIELSNYRALRQGDSILFKYRGREFRGKILEIGDSSLKLLRDEGGAHYEVLINMPEMKKIKRN